MTHELLYISYFKDHQIANSSIHEPLCSKRCQKSHSLACRFIQFTQAIIITMPYSVVVFTVRDFMSTDSKDSATEAQVGKAAGLLAGVYSLAQFLSSYAWGWGSDRYGRKPVIMIGLASSFFSIIMLGISRSYPAAVCSRFLGGLFNGYLVALKSSVAELFGDEQQAKALAYLSFGWGAGSTLGPVVGGFLMHPCKNYALGAACSRNGIFQIFPYLLPYLTAAVAAMFSVACTQSILPETLSTLQTLGRCCKKASASNTWPRLLDVLKGGSTCSPNQPDDEQELLSTQREYSSVAVELVPVESDRPIMAYHTGSTIHRSSNSFNGSSGASRLSQQVSYRGSEGGEVELRFTASATQAQVTTLAPSASDSGYHGKGRHTVHCVDMVSKECMALSVEGGLEVADSLSDRASHSFQLERDSQMPAYSAPWHTQRVLVALISGYGLIAFMFCLLDEVVPIYASTPRQHNGLGMTGSQLSIPFSIGGAAMMLAVFMYPSVQHKIGCHRCLQVGLLLFVCSCGLYPSCVLIDRYSCVAAYLLFIFTTCIRCMSAAFTFTSSMVLINIATNRMAPNEVGGVNGAAQALVALLRGLAPFLGGYFWSLSVSSSVSHSQFIVFSFDVLWALASFVLYEHIKG